MNEVTCPICGVIIKPDSKGHLADQHRLIDPGMQNIALHLMKLEDRVVALEKYRGYEANE